MNPPDRTFRLQVWLDHALRPLGGSLTAYDGDECQRVKPLDAGPFDSLDDAVTALVSGVDVQGSLW